VAGQLVVIGTGIRTTGQLTVEAIALLKRADEVLHIVSDPVATAVIRSLAEGRETSLVPLYREGELRRKSYQTMVETILGRVRAGSFVVAAFYGHPGVFAFVPHEAIRRAREEGFNASMLPGISAEDCLFADLGVDPASRGCCSYEATDFLLFDHPIDPTCHLILWQVGVLCDWTYRAEGYKTAEVPALVDKLAEHYPLDHEVVLYRATVYPGCPSHADRVRLAQLPSRELLTAHTLYVPPAAKAPVDPKRAHLFSHLRAVTQVGQ
jgi:uncharacterized protein YabN with tetrapyrrole methylase and pyrophosphatase domain